MDKGGLLRKDAVFFSIHNFIGGIQSASVLLVKKQLVKGDQAIEAIIKDTAELCGILRSGLVLHLKQTIGG